jgi:MFS transporter, DHA1 family, tetracycline resistance protein
MSAYAPPVEIAAEPLAPQRSRAARLLHRPAIPYIVAFAAAALGAGLGRAITTTYLPVLLSEIRDAPGLIGMIMLVNAGAGFGVPLVVGVWSDRLQSSGRGRRMPFIFGGMIVTAGGLAAVALGFSSSYLVLALAGTVVYVGLNAVTTAHRALVPEIFPASGRARATSAQELALLVGGLAGIAVGGALTGIAPWAPFALAAVAVPLLTLPTLTRTRERHAPDAPERRESRPAGWYLKAAARPGVRGLLAAQILWVLGYAALPAFFLLYAERELGLAASPASLLLAAFGIMTAAAIVAAGRVRNPERHKPLLIAGVALMGGGFLAVALATNLVMVGGALLAGAIGFGLVSTLGFPLFSSLIPEGEAGGYTALYFSVRSIASAIALPAAGWVIAATGSYRALFVLGGIATLTALIPLSAVGSRLVRAWASWTVRWVGALVALYSVILVLGLLLEPTGLHRVDEWLFRAINGLGPGPDLLWEILDPHTRNYVVLIAIAVVLAAITSLRSVPRVFSLVMLSAILSWGLLEGVYAAYERDRPEEVVPADEITLNGHTWARLESYPSGHMAITAALAVAIALAFPRLRPVLWLYIGAVAFTRVMFGAHFPLDTVAGTVLGAGSALAVHALIQRLAATAAARRQRARYREAVETS